MMIITRTPYRIPIGGGGTDQDFYFKSQGSFFISLAFDQYIYIYITNRKLDKKIVTQTTSVEFKDNIKDVSHPFIRATLNYFNIKEQIQIGTFSTLPTSIGLGLGTSSSFLVGLINALSKYKGLNYSKIKISEIAYKIEREILGLSGGYQDQYIASLGGFRKFTISKKGIIRNKKLNLKNKNLKFIEENFILVFSNRERRSESIIKSQKKNIENSILIYNEIKKIAKKIEIQLINGNFENIASLFNEHWVLKKKLSNEISSKDIDRILNRFLNHGAIGGKIIGAGGGGFYLLIKDPKKNTLLKYLNKNNYYKINFNIDFKGTSIINS